MFLCLSFVPKPLLMDAVTAFLFKQAIGEKLGRRWAVKPLLCIFCKNTTKPCVLTHARARSSTSLGSRTSPPSLLVFGLLRSEGSTGPGIGEGVTGRHVGWGDPSADCEFTYGLCWGAVGRGSATCVFLVGVCVPGFVLEGITVPNRFE